MICVCPEGPNLFCAHQCTTCVWGIQICIICVCPEDPNLCSLMHHVCMEGPKSVSVNANAPRWSVSAWRVPTCFVLANAPRLSGGSKSIKFVSAWRIPICSSDKFYQNMIFHKKRWIFIKGLNFYHGPLFYLKGTISNKVINISSLL